MKTLYNLKWMILVICVSIGTLQAESNGNSTDKNSGRKKFKCSQIGKQKVKAFRLSSAKIKRSRKEERLDEVNRPRPSFEKSHRTIHFSRS